jgi:hypothetical protein
MCSARANVKPEKEAHCRKNAVEAGTSPGDRFVVLVVLAVASGCTYSPLFGRGLSRVNTEDAADASGVMITIPQLRQVVGISLPGRLFLSRASFPAPPVVSGHALAITGIAVGLAAVVGAGFAHRTRKVAQDT